MVDVVPESARKRKDSRAENIPMAAPEAAWDSKKDKDGTGALRALGVDVTRPDWIAYTPAGAKRPSAYVEMEAHYFSHHHVYHGYPHGRKACKECFQ